MPAAVAGLVMALGACGSSPGRPAAGSPASSAGSTSTSAGAASTAPGRSVGGNSPVTAAPIEQNPPGDIPDSVAYVTYSNPAGRYSFAHPEGWAQTQNGNSVAFTDKLNGITADTVAATQAPTAATATTKDVPALSTAQPAFQLVAVKDVTLPGGAGVLITYRRNSQPDPVTGKVFRDEVQRYEIFGAGHEVHVEMYGPVGADNVDPYTKISRSLRLA